MSEDEKVTRAELERVIWEYSHIDNSELCEDKFQGHWDVVRLIEDINSIVGFGDTDD